MQVKGVEEGELPPTLKAACNARTYKKRNGAPNRSKQLAFQGWCWHLMVRLRALAVVPPSGTVHRIVPLTRPPETVGPDPARLLHQRVVSSGGTDSHLHQVWEDGGVDPPVIMSVAAALPRPNTMLPAIGDSARPSEKKKSRRAESKPLVVRAPFFQKKSSRAGVVSG